MLYGTVWYGMVWYGMVWYGMVCYGMAWYGMVWYGVVWYGMVWYGMVWPSNSKEMFKHSNQWEHGNQDQVWCVNIQYIREYMFSEVHRGF